MEKGAPSIRTLLIANKNHSHLDKVRVNPKLYKKTVVETLGGEMYGGGGGSVCV